MAQADDWTMYLGDLSHTSFRAGETQINTTNVSQLQVLWKNSLGAPVASAVTVSSGSLFFGDWAGNFRSMNAATGTVAWSQFLGVAPSPVDEGCMAGVGVTAQPVVTAQTVYAGGGDSAVYAMDRNTGQIQWRVALADPANGGYLWSSLMLYQNALYVGIASLTDCPLVRGGLARIPLDNPTHPQIVYFVPSDQLGAGIWSTPAIDEQNNLIYVTTGNSIDNTQDAGQGVWGSAMLALDAATLQVQSYFFMPLTSIDDDPDWGSSPLLFQSGDQQLVAANGKNGMMYVLHRPDLALVWSYKLATDCDSPTLGCGSVSTPAFDGATLVTGSGQPDGATLPIGMVYAFDPASQTLRWSYTARAAVLAPVTLTPGLVFVASSSGLAILDATAGTELWNDGGRTGLYSQPVVANGVLYTTYINGNVVAWAPGPSGDSALSVTPNSLSFSYTLRERAPAPQSIVVSSTPSVSFTVSSDSPWLTTNLQSGNTPATVRVAINPQAVSPGDYHGNLTFASSGGEPVSLPVTLTVKEARPVRFQVPNLK
jgi:outer membrane protein assembly factor BamB